MKLYVTFFFYFDKYWTLVPMHIIQVLTNKAITMKLYVTSFSTLTLVLDDDNAEPLMGIFITCFKSF